MAKHYDPPPPHMPTPEPEPAPVPAGKGGTYVVIFPGQAPVTVEAGSDEEAVKKAAAALGVVSSESPPSVVKT